MEISKVCSDQQYVELLCVLVSHAEMMWAEDVSCVHDTRILQRKVTEWRCITSLNASCEEKSALIPLLFSELVKTELQVQCGG